MYELSRMQFVFFFVFPLMGACCGERFLSKPCLQFLTPNSSSLLL